MAEPLTDTRLVFLLADLRLGLTFAQCALQTRDPWTLAANRAKAEKLYDRVLRLKNKAMMSPAVRAYVRRRLEQLRLAIQSAYGSMTASR